MVDNLCPVCLDKGETVVMERHEWPVEGYVKLVCPVCGFWRLDREKEGEG